MPTLYVLCGPAGCGKSTWAHQIVSRNIAEGSDIRYASRDEFRFAMLKEEEDYFSHEKATFRKFANCISETLIDGFDIIADATHLNKYARKKLTQAIDRRYTDYTIVYVVFTADPEVCVEHNRNRTGRRFVPENVIRDMCRKFEPPTYEEDPRIVGIVSV